MINLEINHNLCDHCNLCVASCTNGGLSVQFGQVRVDERADCRDCRSCEFICDRGAINWNYEIVLKSTDHI